MRLIVSGLSGFVGRHLESRLCDTGHDPTVLVRRTPASAGEIEGPQDLASLPIDAFAKAGPVSAAVHLAALNPSRREPAFRDPAALTRANGEGTVAFFRAAIAAGADHLVLVSTANVHAPQDEPIIPASPLAPTSSYARSKAEGERLAEDLARRSGVRLTILRPAPVYGAGGRGMIALLVRLASSPVPIVMPSGLGARSVVSVESLVSAILAVLERCGDGSARYLVADERPVTPVEIVRGLRSAEGRPQRVFEAPGLVDPVLARIPRLGENLRSFRKPFVLDWRDLASNTTWTPEPDTIAALLRSRMPGRT